MRFANGTDEFIEAARFAHGSDDGSIQVFYNDKDEACAVITGWLIIRESPTTS